MTAPALNLTIRRGESPEIPIRIETDVLVYTAITAMAQSAPLRVTAPGHGIPDGWRAGIMGAGGMTTLNIAWDKIDAGEADALLRRVTVIDADTVEFNAVNAAGFSAYTSGGHLVHYAPLDLAQFVSARMDVKSSVSGAVLASFNTADTTLVLDTGANALTFLPGLAGTSALTARDKLFDVELVRADGSVLALCSAASVLTVLPEITTST